MNFFSINDNVVFCLRGVPAIGKSTWLKKHNLEDYTLSPDTFRLMLSNPVIDKATGQAGINQSVSKEAWQMCYDCLISRCKFGGATFFDATFMHPKAFDTLKEILPPIYKIVVIDFVKVGLAEAHRRNEGRKNTIRYVPPAVLDRMWETGKNMSFEGMEKYDFDDIIIDL